jgi:predicted metal-binding protein
MKQFFFKPSFSRLLLLVGILLITQTTFAQFWITVGSGVNNNVYAFTKDTVNNILYVGGRFTDASGTTANRVAAWNGTSWTALGNGFDSDVNALYYDYNSNTLYAGGAFTFSGATPITRVAKWDGTLWQALGSGCDAQVLALTGDNNGNLYVGGSFTTAGGVSAARIARWNGTSWSALGTGIGSGSNYVEALTFYNGDLFAGGQFTTAGSVTANGVARWNGANWFDLNGGVSGLSVRVSAFKEVNGELICGGTFTSAGGVAANSLAKWNGASWTAYPGGITGGQAKIKSLGYLFNTLYVGGNFSLAGGNAVSNIAAYDGTTWSNLNGGVNNQVDALMNYGNEMYAGGAFTTAGGNPATYVARYRTTCLTNATIATLSPSCFGLCNGSATVSATGNAPFTYQWSTSPVQTGATATDLCAGTYTVTITDNIGCSISQQTTITQPPLLTISFSSNNPVCNGLCNGNALASNNGQGSVSYLWNTLPAQTTQTAINLCAGTYSVTITDSAGCTATDSVIITDPAANVLTLSGINPTCNNYCDGIASVVSTGTAPFTYDWNTIPVQNSDTATGLCSGTYSVTVTDNLGCSVSDSVTLINPAAATIQFATTDATCFGSCNATATATSTGTAPFSYLWNTIPAQVNATATNLCAGIYSVTVTDSNQCAVTDSVEVFEPIANQLTFNNQDSRCAIACNGAATVISTGQAPFTYQWSTGGNTNGISSLCAGNYTVTVTDNIGCSITETTIINNAAPLPISFTTQFSGCNGLCIGAATADIIGLSGLNFLWSTGDAVATIDSLCPGYYNVTITDNLGCIVSDSVEIINQPVFLNLSITTPTCVGLCDGIASINPVGVPPFQWQWSTGDTTSLTIGSLCAGNYFITISDSVGCVGSDSVIVNDPPALLYSASHIDATCAGACNGISTISATGNGNLSYLWNTIPPQTDSTVTNLCFGYTSFTITDINNCSVTDSVLIFEPSPIFIANNFLGITCNGNCDGFVRALPSGGTPGYSFEWSTGVLFDSIINACPGTYTVTVTDANLCTATETYVFTEPDPITINFTVTDASCATCLDGSIVASASGGTPPYDYLYPVLGIADSAATNLGTGYYLFCTQDFNNCLQCDSVFVDFFTSVNVISPLVSDIRIFPNPFTDKAYIRINSEETTTFAITVYDMSGRVIEVPVVPMNVLGKTKTYSIINNGLKSGLYQIKVTSGKEVVGMGKFMIN